MYSGIHSVTEAAIMLVPQARTIAYLDKLGGDHDAVVHGWKQSLLSSNSVPQVCAPAYANIIIACML